MKKAMKQIRAEEASGVGCVVAVAGQNIAIVDAAGGFTARQAASCLVEAEPGDEVFWVLHGERYYVLSVLTRAADAPMNVRLHGGAVVRAVDGPLEFRGETDVSIVAGDTMRLETKVLECHAKKSRFFLAKIYASGDVALLKINAFTVVAESMRQFADNLTQKLRTATRRTEEAEVVNCGSLHQTVTDAATMRAGQVLMLAEKVVRIDGESIQMG